MVNFRRCTEPEIIPAGWFTKAVNFEVAADVAAPDILVETR